MPSREQAKTYTELLNKEIKKLEKKKEEINTANYKDRNKMVKDRNKVEQKIKELKYAKKNVNDEKFVITDYVKSTPKKIKRTYPRPQKVKTPTPKTPSPETPSPGNLFLHILSPLAPSNDQIYPIEEIPRIAKKDAKTIKMKKPSPKFEVPVEQPELFSKIPKNRTVRRTPPKTQKKEVQFNTRVSPDKELFEDKEMGTWATAKPQVNQDPRLPGYQIRYGKSYVPKGTRKSVRKATERTARMPTMATRVIELPPPIEESEILDLVPADLRKSTLTAAQLDKLGSKTQKPVTMPVSARHPLKRKTDPRANERLQNKTVITYHNALMQGRRQFEDKYGRPFNTGRADYPDGFINANIRKPPRL